MSGEMGMHVVGVGTIGDGIRFYGPFNTGVEAVDWATENIPDEYWEAVPVHAPDSYD